MVKGYITTVKCKGSFFNRKTNERWSSNLCSIKVNYNHKEGKINIIRVYRQKSNTADEWIHPHFKEDQFEIMTKRAKWNYDTFFNKKSIELKEKSGKKNKHHKEDKCERCKEKGIYCK